MNDRQHDFQAKELVENLPLLPGVYRFFDGKGEVLYVGKAKQLKCALRPISRKPIFHRVSA